MRYRVPVDVVPASIEHVPPVGNGREPLVGIVERESPEVTAVGIDPMERVDVLLFEHIICLILSRYPKEQCKS